MDIVSRGNKACDVLKVHVLSSGNLTLHTKAMMHAMNSTTDLCMRIITWSEIATQILWTTIYHANHAAGIAKKTHTSHIRDVVDR